VDLWEVETGKKLFNYGLRDITVRNVAFAEGDQQFLAITEKIMGHNAFLQVCPVVEDESITSD